MQTLGHTLSRTIATLKARHYWLVLISLIAGAIHFAAHAIQLQRQGRLIANSPRDAFSHLLSPQSEVRATILPLNQWPGDLQLNSEIYPKSNTDYTDSLRRLFTYANQCGIPPKVDESLWKALLWHRYLCKNLDSLPDDFLMKPPHLHPAGVSFAKLQYDRKELNSDQISLQQFHFRELATLPLEVFKTSTDQLLYRLSQDSLQGQIWLDRTSISENFVVLPIYNQETHTTVYVLNAIDWKRYWQSLGVSPYLRTTSKPCNSTLNDLCFEVSNEVNRRGVTAFIFLFTAVLFTVFSKMQQSRAIRRQRQNDAANKQRMLSVLTHELRTPATVLRIETEALRGLLESANPTTQDSILRVMGSSNRLVKTVRSSESYLRFIQDSEANQYLIQSDVNLTDVLKDLSDEYSKEIAFQIPTQELGVVGNQNWIEQCLRNILDNALKHGTKPIEVMVECTSNSVHVSIQDQGPWKQPTRSGPDASEAPYHKTISEIRPFEKSSDSSGMGLGLFVTKEFMRIMNGTMTTDTANSRVLLTWRLADAKTIVR